MPTLLGMSCFLYGRLLVLYPQEFRSNFREEMLQVFEDVLRDAIRQRGTLGMLSPWCFALCELVTLAVPLRLQTRTAIAAALSFLTSSALFLALFRAVS